MRFGFVKEQGKKKTKNKKPFIANPRRKSPAGTSPLRYVSDNIGSPSATATAIVTAYLNAGMYQTPDTFVQKKSTLFTCHARKRRTSFIWTF